MVDAHKNLSAKTPSLSINKKVASSSTNLAYIKSEPPTPEKNVTIIDYISEVPENVVHNSNPFEYKMYSNSSDNVKPYSLHDVNGNAMVPTDDILITDVFYESENPLEPSIPLYYSETLDGYYKKTIGNEGSKETYRGTDIVIYNRDIKSLGSNEKYEVVLEQIKVASEDPCVVCKIHIFSNFTSNTTNTYLVEYPKYDYASNRVFANSNEIYNGTEFFLKIEDDNSYESDGIIKKIQEEGYEYNGISYNSDSNVYAIKDNIVYAPSYVYEPSMSTRTPKYFKYQIEANLQTTYSQDVTGNLNVGIYYIGDVVDNNLDYLDVLTTLVSGGRNSQFMSPYLNIQNPHTFYNNSGKTDKYYWLINLDMPFNQYRDYDLIIITGYGTVDSDSLTVAMQNNLKQFLKLGGKVWIDNAGQSDSEVLKFSSLPTSITGSNSLTTDNSVTPYTNEDSKTATVINDSYYINYQNRYHIATGEQEDLGYRTTASSRWSITFSPADEDDNWIVLYKHTDNTTSIAVKKVESKGQILISDCGILRAASDLQQGNINAKFLVNVLLTISEDIWVRTPWFSESVYNKDSLLTQEYNIPSLNQRYTNVFDGYIGEPAAKKVLYQTTREAIKPYIDISLYNSPGYFYINKDEPNLGTDVNVDIDINGNEPVYAYTYVDTGKIDTIIEEAELGQGVLYDENTLITVSVDVPYNITITAHTYIRTAFGYMEEENPSAPTVLNGTVNMTDGLKEIAVFSTIRPGTISYYNSRDYGEFWTDNSKVFYKIRPGTYSATGQFIEEDWSAGIIVRNKVTGKNMPVHYKKEDNGDWYWYFVVPKEMSDSDGANIAIYVYSKEYSLKGVKRAYSVRAKDSIKISASIPSGISIRDPWFLKISNGVFTRVVDGKTYVYQSSEYDKQAFNPGFPFMRVIEEQAQYVDIHTIRVINTPIAKEDLEGRTIKIVLRRPNMEDQELTYIKHDSRYGLIQIEERIDFTDNILVDYYYVEENLYYKGYEDEDNVEWYLNLNPTIGHEFGHYNYVGQAMDVAVPPTFTRNSVAYNSTSGQYLINEMRLEDGKFSKAGTIEEETTNFLLRSYQFNSASWSKSNLNVVPNISVAPDGSKVADKLAPTILNGTITQLYTTNPAGKTYTFSVWLKADVQHDATIKIQNNDVTEAYDTTVQVTTNWQRFSISGEFTLSKTGVQAVLWPGGYNGTTNAVYVWGAQLEEKPFPTSYVPTVSTTMTRDKETLTIPTTGVINLNECTIQVWVYVTDEGIRSVPNGSSRQIFWTSTSGNQNRISLGRTTQWYATIGDKDANLTTIWLADDLAEGWHLFTVRWNSSEFALLIDDGTTKGTAPSPTIPSTLATVVTIGSGAGGSLQVNTLIDDIRIAKKARTDSEIMSDYNSSLPLIVDQYTTYKLTFDNDVSAKVFGYAIEPSLVSGSELLNKSIYLYMLPYQIKDAGGSVLSSNTSYNIRHTFSDVELESILQVNPGALKLATVMVRETQGNISDIVLLDTRSRGGGLRESVTLSKMEEVNKATNMPLPSEHYWDISNWNNPPYFTNGTIVVELPKSILDKFTKDEVTKIVNKHVAYGSFVIIDYK